MSQLCAAFRKSKHRTGRELPRHGSCKQPARQRGRQEATNRRGGTGDRWCCADQSTPRCDAFARRVVPGFEPAGKSSGAGSQARGRTSRGLHVLPDSPQSPARSLHGEAWHFTAPKGAAKPPDTRFADEIVCAPRSPDKETSAADTARLQDRGRVERSCLTTQRRVRRQGESGLMLGGLYRTGPGKS